MMFLSIELIWFRLIQRDIINKSNEEFDFINISDEIQNKE